MRCAGPPPDLPTLDISVIRRSLQTRYFHGDSILLQSSVCGLSVAEASVLAKRAHSNTICCLGVAEASVLANPLKHTTRVLIPSCIEQILHPVQTASEVSQHPCNT